MSGEKKISELMKAAKQGYAGGVVRLAEGGADLREQDEEGLTALDHMLRKGDIDTTLRLLDLGGREGDVGRSLGGSDFKPLHWAAWLGRADWAQELLNKGAGVDAKSKTGVTPLSLALRQEQIECADILLASGANAKVWQGVLEKESLLTTSARMALPKAVFWCLKNKADGGETEAEAKRSIEYLSRLDVSVEGQRDALSGTVAYLEAAQIRASAPGLARKGRKKARSAL